MRIVDVTLAVPTWNGGELLDELLQRCAELDPAPAAKIAIDSSSDDASAERARAAGFSVHVIPRAEFDHGATRQRMAELANTRFVAFLSQDALPERDYLDPLVSAMDDDRTAAVSARILPRDGASALARRTVLASGMASSEPRCIECSKTPFLELPARERRALLVLDDVASLIRRECLLTFPFPRTMMGEDAAFAAKVLAAGWRIRFEPRSVVHHSHEYSALAAFRRYRDDARHVGREYGIAVRPNLFSFLRGALYEVLEDYRYLRASNGGGTLLDRIRSPWLRAWQTLGQWWGSFGAEAP